MHPIGLVAASIALTLAWREIPKAAAGALLHPSRHAMLQATPAGCTATSFDGVDVVLKGWQCRAAPAPRAPRATIVLLHGVADNRASWRGAIVRLTNEGFDVIAYDSRGHGESSGDSCTYGYFEKQDLRRVIDTLPAGPILLIGTSLGAAVALQTAAIDPRVSAVVAAETFSDLRTIAAERAPAFLTRDIVGRAFSIAEQRAGFSVAEVSPVDSASRIVVPVLLIHGADDVETPPDHSRRVYAALPGSKRLIMVSGAGHNHSLSSARIWSEIDRWILHRKEPVMADG